MWQAQALPVAVPVGLCMPGLARGARAGKREWVQPGQHSAQHVSRQIIPAAGLRAGAAAVFFPLRLCCRMTLGLVGPLHLLSLGLGQRLAGRCYQPLACRLVACQPAAHGRGDLLTTLSASLNAKADSSFTHPSQQVMAVIVSFNRSSFTALLTLSSVCVCRMAYRPTSSSAALL